MVSSLFMKHPLLIKSVIPGTLAIAAGDALCQRLEGKEEWCAERTARMAVTGAVLVTPLSHYLGNGIDRVLPKGKSSPVVVERGRRAPIPTRVFLTRIPLTPPPPHPQPPTPPRSSPRPG